MEFTFQEQLELDNSREHLKVVRVNLRIANEELNTALRYLERTKLELAKCEAKKHKAIQDYIDTLDMVSAQDRREASLLLRESNVDIEEKEIERLIEKAKIELENVNREIIQTKTQGNHLVGSYSEILLDLQNKINESNKKIQQNEEINEGKLGKKKKLEDEITRLGGEIEEAQKGLNKFRDESFTEMKKTILLIDVEKNKIKNPLELIKREQEKLEILKTDLAIIKVRLTKQFNEQNPEKILPLELQ